MDDSRLLLRRQIQIHGSQSTKGNICSSSNSPIHIVFSITERTYNLARTTKDAKAVKHPVTVTICLPLLSLETGPKVGTVSCLAKYILQEVALYFPAVRCSRDVAMKFSKFSLFNPLSLGRVNSRFSKERYRRSTIDERLIGVMWHCIACVEFMYQRSMCKSLGWFLGQAFSTGHKLYKPSCGCSERQVSCADQKSNDSQPAKT